MPVSPWLRVSYNQSMVNVDHELAALPPNQGDVFPCESESLLYEVYHYYLAQRDFTEDSFFNAIRLLRTVNGAKEFGTEVTDERQAYWFSQMVFMFFVIPSLRFVHLVSRQLRVHGSVYIRAWDKFLSSP